MKFSHILERSPRDWETTMHQNVVLAFFHTQNICHSAWKILRTTLCCFVFLQSRGKGLKSKANYGKICPIVFLAFQTLSPGLEKNKRSMCGSESFPRMVTYILCVENCQKLHLDAELSPNPGETVLKCENISWTQDLRVKHMEYQI